MEKDNSDNSDYSKNIIYRVAWYHKILRRFDYGSWQKYKNLKNIVNWTEEQNIKYPLCKYWIEGYKLMPGETIAMIEQQEKLACFNMEYFFDMDKFYNKGKSSILIEDNSGNVVDSFVIVN